MSAVIEPVGEGLRIRFETWDQESYRLFLKTKALPEHDISYDEILDTYTIETPRRFARILGLELPPLDLGWLPLPDFLHDYQEFLSTIALEAKRYAIWADTGLGKTLIEWEWARQVQHRSGGRVLGVIPLNLIPQSLEMARAFYGAAFADAVTVLQTREELIAWCKGGAPGIAITNPQKFIPLDAQEVIPEVTFLAGVFIDESSLLKTGGGKIKWAIIKSCRGVEYKLSCTATPAPNDPIEYASQAAFLEKIRDEGEVIWTYFVRNDDGEWKVKDHAQAAFYRFMSGWSCYLRSPARYGFKDNLKDLPEPTRIVHQVKATDEQLRLVIRAATDTAGQLSMVPRERLGLVDRLKMSQASSGFVYEEGGKARQVPSYKPAEIAKIAREEVAAGRQVLIWTQFDETAEILADMLDLRIPGDPRLRHATLTGKLPFDERAPLIERFRAGDVDVLITRPKLLGFGINLQNCGAMIFADINDSYEEIYQAERRAYRYGQTLSVRIHFPIVEELQGVVWRNVVAKREQFERDVDRMERLYVEAMRELLPRRAA
jgi:hypothetical protein